MKKPKGLLSLNIDLINNNKSKNNNINSINSNKNENNEQQQEEEETDNEKEGRTTSSSARSSSHASTQREQPPPSTTTVTQQEREPPPSSVSSSLLFRCDGISIGYDYLRCNNRTITRGELSMDKIAIHEIIGRGAFSTVYRSVWTKTKTTKKKTDDNYEQKKKKKLQGKEEDEVVVEGEEEIVQEIVAVKMFNLRYHDDGLVVAAADPNNSNSHSSSYPSLSPIDCPKRKMLIKELRTLCNVNHPCLVQMYGAFLQQHETTTTGDDTHTYTSSIPKITMVLEYMDEGSLHGIISTRFLRDNITNNNQTIIASIAYQILMGLSYLHSLKFIHRDLKSDNVLLDQNGAVKLCDFGTAAFGASTSTSTLISSTSTLMNTTVLGTAKYMAPERLRAKPYGRSSDMWSFGLILLECLTGQPPFQDITSIVDLCVTIEEMDIENDDDNNKIIIPPHTENGLREMIAMSLQKDPAKRIPSKVLLQSPWFSQQHSIRSLDDARELTKKIFI